MDEDLKQLKSVLRSLVVSSPTQVDVRSLLRDYRNMVGKQIPLAKYGYKDPIIFLKERFSDCFLFQGSAANPELTLIVPDALKHIDKFVQKQKSNPTVKFKGKRRSVPESAVKPIESNLIVKSFQSKNVQRKQQNMPSNETTNEEIKKYHPPPTQNPPQTDRTDDTKQTIDNGNCSQSVLQNFLKKRTALYSSHYAISEESSNNKESLKDGDDSGRQTSSSSSSSKKTQLEDLKREIRDIVLGHPDGVWCTDILRLYRERYGCELNFSRFGFTSVLSVACELADISVSRQPAGDWLLRDARAGPAPLPVNCAHAPRAPRPAAPCATPDPDDALPGVAFEADVFPEDCMHFLESIPSASLVDIVPGTMLEVAVAEVYSPSHFWLLRLGERHNIAMENIMDEMNEYYTHGEGKNRTLALGAVRVGHYCTSRYEGDWHRSLIVKIIDSDTVKVRHVDYGTVDRCDVSELRALRRQWAWLEAQALRARLAGARPPAAGRRWPRPAAHHFLRLVRDRRLVANVVAVDERDGALEVLLIDTATREDRCVSAELVRAGHADARADSALGTSECYLYPRFEALENGDTPNFAEIHAYLRDGIALEFVDDYRRHVPPCLPSPPPTSLPSLPSTSLRSPPPTSFHSPPPTSLPSLPPTSLPSLPPTSLPPLPLPCPPAAHPPPPPAASSVSLSAAECEMFTLLSCVNPGAAHQYMLQAVSRAIMARSCLNPHAKEFRMVSAETQTGDTIRPPPGFEKY
ncbi:uncharacterized protein LOC126774775 [Nymphalis io]|uniref:uncharacterized protein LOC126774775 n=1 Tax=Inachis io TaxID=171585 RepID=UPI0021697F7F|nr:uncharacterized protein LOC126774775 [Nymphalis io]XP_050352279.1 uncharacterized protein LOC126774775 [Nymphalis io]